MKQKKNYSNPSIYVAIDFKKRQRKTKLRKSNFILLIQHGPPNNFFFLENALKKTTEHFLKFLFYLKVQSSRLTMENNFIQMAASTGHAVAYMIDPIFKHIIDCV